VQAAHFSPMGEPVRITEFALGWNRLQLGSKDGNTRSETTATALTVALEGARASFIVGRAIKRVSNDLVEAVREELADAASGSSSKSSQVTGLRETLRRAALDVLLDLAFGVRLGRVSSRAQTAAEDGERRGRLAMLELVLSDIWQLVNTAVLADHVPILRVATGELTNRCRFLARQRDRILRDLVDEAKKAQSKADSSAGESSEGRDTLVKALLAGQEASVLTDGEVVDVLADFLQRGALPIAATVEWALAELAKNTEVRADFDSRIRWRRESAHTYRTWKL
jgi:cytochrome P450